MAQSTKERFIICTIKKQAQLECPGSENALAHSHMKEFRDSFDKYTISNI